MYETTHKKEISFLQKAQRGNLAVSLHSRREALLKPLKVPQRSNFLIILLLGKKNLYS